jgi:outer membrane protein TolC
LSLDPVFDRTTERNEYRRKLIERDQAARALQQQEDDIKLQVRDSWRTLDQAKRNFEISEIGVKLAERRVEEQTIRAELGILKAAQDQVDAQNDLVNSKNQRTTTLVAHTIARLNFWNNMGILYIKDGGKWEEVKDPRAATGSATATVPRAEPLPPPALGSTGETSAGALGDRTGSGK